MAAAKLGYHRPMSSQLPIGYGVVRGYAKLRCGTHVLKARARSGIDADVVPIPWLSTGVVRIGIESEFVQFLMFDQVCPIRRLEFLQN